MTMVFVSHDLAIVQQKCSSVCTFKEGRVEDSGTSDFIFSRSGNPSTRALISAPAHRFMLSSAALSPTVSQTGTTDLSMNDGSLWQ
jgi:ABC-type microcin C transport system duplicated ATPase subunit YejF